ncbi:MAG: ROK family protein [Planctomycetota bacterium]|jgi:glucokinase
MKTVLTADLGGTKCRFALVTEDLRVLGERQIPTPRDRDAFLDALEENFRSLRQLDESPGAGPLGIGIGTAGVVHRGGRVIDYAPNLPVEENCSLADLIEQRLSMPTTLINDGRAAALGEFRRGNASGSDPLLALFFGTGIGIGLVVDSAPYAGVSNAAGEIGHTVFRPDGLPCVCGRMGCYEAYCAGGPMCTRAQQEVGAPPDGSRRWTVGKIFAAAESDPRCRAILDDCALAAGAMVASACVLLNPQAVVLGGGVLLGWPDLRGRIESFVQSWCSEVVLRDLSLVSSLGGSDAILWGAAAETGKLW